MNLMMFGFKGRAKALFLRRYRSPPHQPWAQINPRTINDIIFRSHNSEACDVRIETSRKLNE